MSGEAEITADGDPFSRVPHYVLELSGNAVKLYAVMMKYANNSTRVAWPSRSKLATDMGFKQARTMDALITELEDAGAITVTRGKLKNGVRQVNRYNLNGSRGVVREDALGVVRDDAGGSASPRRGVVREDALELEPMNYNQELEPTTPLPGLESVQPEKADPLAGFDEFYAIYPRKVGGLSAKKAWPKAVRNAGGVERIIAGAKRERDMVAQKLRKLDFVAHPATWLNKGKWDEYETGFVPEALTASVHTLRPVQPPTWDHSRPLLATQLTPEERKFLTDRAVKAGRPFGAFTELDAQEMIRNRVPK